MLLVAKGLNFYEYKAAHKKDVRALSLANLNIKHKASEV